MGIRRVSPTDDRNSAGLLGLHIYRSLLNRTLRYRRRVGRSHVFPGRPHMLVESVIRFTCRASSVRPR
jgi:hypothetical protein